MRNNKRKLVGVLFGITLMVSNPAMAQAKKVGGYTLPYCSMFNESQDYSINYCNTAVLKKLDKLVDRKPNFGKHSVLLRYWNKEANYWEFMAVNTKTKQVNLFGFGVRSNGENPKKINYSIDYQKNMLCSKGDNFIYEGFIEKPSFHDDQKDVDYCTLYDDQRGFGDSYEVDAKTRKVIKDAWWLQ